MSSFLHSPAQSAAGSLGAEARHLTQLATSNAAARPAAAAAELPPGCKAMLGLNPRAFSARGLKAPWTGYSARAAAVAAAVLLPPGAPRCCCSWPVLMLVLPGCTALVPLALLHTAASSQAASGAALLLLLLPRSAAAASNAFMQLLPSCSCCSVLLPGSPNSPQSPPLLLLPGAMLLPLSLPTPFAVTMSAAVHSPQLPAASSTPSSTASPAAAPAARPAAAGGLAAAGAVGPALAAVAAAGAVVSVAAAASQPTSSASSCRRGKGRQWLVQQAKNSKPCLCNGTTPQSSGGCDVMYAAILQGNMLPKQLGNRQTQPVPYHPLPTPSAQPTSKQFD